MKRLSYLLQALLGILIFIVQLGCANQKSSIPEGWTKMNDEAMMTRSQIKGDILAANRGDVSAGERLYQYYTFAGNNANVSKSEYWLKWLADRGVPFAEFNFGKGLIDDGKNPYQINEGLKWMIKAKKDGYAGGDELLKRYKSEYGDKGQQ